MNYTEFTGKTVDEAIAKGLKELGITVEEADIRILEEGKKKLFKSIAARVEIAVKEAKIAEIKSDIRAFFEDFINDLNSHTDAEGYIELSEYSKLMTEFAEEYTQYINDRIYTLTDDELKQRAFLEMTLIYNEYVSMIDEKVRFE